MYRKPVRVKTTWANHHNIIQLKSSWSCTKKIYLAASAAVPAVPFPVLTHCQSVKSEPFIKTQYQLLHMQKKMPSNQYFLGWVSLCSLLRHNLPTGSQRHSKPEEAVMSDWIQTQSIGLKDFLYLRSGWLISNCTWCHGADREDGLIDCHGRGLILFHTGRDTVTVL